MKKLFILILTIFIFAGCESDSHKEVDEKLTKILKAGEPIKCSQRPYQDYLNREMHTIHLKDGWKISKDNKKLLRNGIEYFDISEHCVSFYK